jgi:N6-adenosine-specific RNA methylase IME4
VNLIQDTPAEEYLCDAIVLEEKARGHSVKPEAFWDLIDPVVDRAGAGPGIELFSRRERPGWNAFGNQVVPLGEDGA